MTKDPIDITGNLQDFKIVSGVELLLEVLEQD